jgi:hypothetical protein
MIVTWSGAGGPAIMPGGVNEGVKTVWRAEDRLIRTIQRDWEKSRNIIHSQRAHDREIQSSVDALPDYNGLNFAGVYRAILSYTAIYIL